MDKKVLIQDLADGLVLRRGLPKKDADVFVRSVFEIIGEYLQTDKIVKVKGLGTFKLVTNLGGTNMRCWVAGFTTTRSCFFLTSNEPIF